jgi:hypothetical protein
MRHSFFHNALSRETYKEASQYTTSSRHLLRHSRFRHRTPPLRICVSTSSSDLSSNLQPTMSGDHALKRRKPNAGGPHPPRPLRYRSDSVVGDHDTIAAGMHQDSAPKYTSIPELHHPRPISTRPQQFLNDQAMNANEQATHTAGNPRPSRFIEHMDSVYDARNPHSKAH